MSQQASVLTYADPGHVQPLQSYLDTRASEANDAASERELDAGRMCGTHKHSASARKPVLELEFDLGHRQSPACLAQHADTLLGIGELRATLKGTFF
ncbi:hypothetical protein HPB48_018470 [Haemaphysalis longicornis]|uniref:Uncharacterized protein n=1 Tax=Haemaphysalis longicornis TaxID=44386 RepID=A0A9J6GCS7_HAELO|nr:hypothetical protein HPB48_018470 [Haemaphysalis longicornis]